jgi:hypothetical protein
MFRWLDAAMTIARHEHEAPRALFTDDLASSNNCQNTEIVAAAHAGNALIGVRAVIARSETTKQSILSIRGQMDCFAGARNDG